MQQEDHWPLQMEDSGSGPSAIFQRFDLGWLSDPVW